MTVEVRPLGVACNMKCTYCYQEPIRDALNVQTRYNMDLILDGLDEVGHEFNLFGGEALLVPKEDLEQLWSYGLQRYGKNGVQTNGSLIDDDHIRMFQDYNVFVGISIDGPGELNNLRWMGTEEKTRATTDVIMENMRKLRQAGVGVGVIITLHKLNGNKEALPRLIQFIEWLYSIGINGGNIHTLEVDNDLMAQKYCLTEEENIEAFMTLGKFVEANPHLRNWKPFGELRSVLSMDTADTTCYWHHCDPMNTQAVYGIEGDGGITNCGRTNKEGIDFYKADDHGYERYVSLYYTPQDKGGCGGCRFWSVCGGSCPGESGSGDWRNKTIHCGTMKATLGAEEKKMLEEGLTPITHHPRLKQAEKIMLDHFKKGRTLTPQQAIEMASEMFKDEPVLAVFKNGERVL